MASDLGISLDKIFKKPHQKKTKFPNASLRKVIYCSGVHRASPDIIPLLGERGNELIKEILRYSTANMIGQGRSSLNENDFNVAMEKMNMKFFSSRA